MRLETPAGLETRPTTEITKEAVFSVIQFEVEGANVLDLFAGSGQMGIEALSRGARHCVFVDSDRACRQAQQKNLAHVKLADKARVVTGDAISFLKSTSGPFDIAFLDPPYERDLAAKTLPLVAAAMSESGVILCESDRKEELPDTAGAFQKKKEYRYGKSKMTLYRSSQQS
jgi:16S rRNA (guanine(966)-N(2))-methyltransferase RsmD